MHRDHRKPDVYGSLTRTRLVGGGDDCERPRYGTGVKPRASPPPAMELPAHGPRARDGPRLAHIGAGEETAMAQRGNSDLQLLQISREAEKLNQMIGSWSRSPSFDGRTSDMAAELLKGALELQESLLMLGKLQGASSLMAQTRRRQSCGFTEQEETLGEMSVVVTGSRRFESRRNQETPKEVRTPVDGSSRNRLEELKKVIKESLHRQNLGANSSGDEKPSCFRSATLPSGNGFGDSCSKKGQKTESSGSAAERKKAKAPNLIARLMGLEDAPQEELRPPKPERKTSSGHPKSFFDVEVPKPSKRPSLEEKPEAGRKTLQEIIEGMQFKGLLRADYSEDPRFGSPVDHHLRGFPRDDEAPPIVIIKPMQKMEEVQMDLVEARHASVWEKGQFFSMMEEEAAMERVISREIDQRNRKYLTAEKVEEEPLEPIVPREIENRAKKYVSMGKRVEELSESAPSRNMENRAEKSVVIEKVEVPSEKNRTSASSHLKQLTKVTNRMRKKPEEVPKPVVDRERSENRSSRSVTVQSGTQNKTAPSTPRKPEKRPVRAKNNLVSIQTSASNNPTRPAPRKSMDTAKVGKTARAKQVGEPAIATQVDSPSSREENVENIPAQEKIITAISPTSSPNPLPQKTEHNSTPSKRDIGKEPSFHYEIMPKRSSHGAAGSPPAHSDRNLFTMAAAESTDHLKRLLLSSPLFLRDAQELFTICRHQPADCQITETRQFKAEASKLLLGVAGELLVARSYRSELLNHPISRSSLKFQETKISINQLVEEICQEMENLRGYSRGGDAAVSGDSLYGRLERDLRGNRVFGCGVWDRGWMEAVPVEEGEAVVQDVEEHVVQVLVEEIAVELVRQA